LLSGKCRGDLGISARVDFIGRKIVADADGGRECRTMR
jgi:hypothetical protein